MNRTTTAALAVLLMSSTAMAQMTPAEQDLADQVSPGGGVTVEFTGPATQPGYQAGQNELNSDGGNVGGDDDGSHQGGLSEDSPDVCTTCPTYGTPPPSPPDEPTRREMRVVDERRTNVRPGLERNRPTQRQLIGDMQAARRRAERRNPLDATFGQPTPEQQEIINRIEDRRRNAPRTDPGERLRAADPARDARRAADILREPFRQVADRARQRREEQARNPQPEDRTLARPLDREEFDRQLRESRDVVNQDVGPIVTAGALGRTAGDVWGRLTRAAPDVRQYERVSTQYSAGTQQAINMELDRRGLRTDPETFPGEVREAALSAGIPTTVAGLVARGFGGNPIAAGGITLGSAAAGHFFDRLARELDLTPNEPQTAIERATRAVGRVVVAGAAGRTLGPGLLRGRDAALRGQTYGLVGGAQGSVNQQIREELGLRPNRERPARVGMRDMSGERRVDLFGRTPEPRPGRETTTGGRERDDQRQATDGREGERRQNAERSDPRDRRNDALDRARDREERQAVGGGNRQVADRGDRRGGNFDARDDSSRDDRRGERVRRDRREGRQAQQPERRDRQRSRNDNT